MQLCFSFFQISFSFFDALIEFSGPGNSICVSAPSNKVAKYSEDCILPPLSECAFDSGRLAKVWCKKLAMISADSKTADYRR